MNRLLLGAALLGGAIPAAAQETPGERLPVARHVLPNGMTFLLLRREGAPTVSFVTHYRAGAVDEWTGISGTAHLFEHMLFKGSTVIGTSNLAAEQGLFPAIDAAADSFTAEFRRGAQADSATLQRLRDRLKTLEDSARTFVVSLQAKPDALVSVYALEDQPPLGWTVHNISHDGLFDPRTDKVKFGPFYDAQPRTLQYDLSVPAGTQGVLCFGGQASADGNNTPFGGDQCLALPGCRLSIAARSGPGLPQLILVGPPGSRALIEASDDLREWVPVTTVLNTTGRVEFTDPDRPPVFASLLSRHHVRVISSIRRYES